MGISNNHPKDYFVRLNRLIDLEAEAEKLEVLTSIKRATATEAEESGNSLVNLTIREEIMGLYGRMLVTFGKRNQNLSLPWTKLGTGTPVILSEMRTLNSSGKEEGLRGVVYRLHKDSIQVVFGEWQDIEDNRSIFRLDRSFDEISRIRQRQALNRVNKAENNRLAELRGVLLGSRTPAFQKVVALQLFYKNLNDSQIQAVRFALSAEDVAIIHGPPGTGKTITLVETIRQITKNGQSILAVAPSNLAVDNLMARLLVAGEKVVRIGNPARISPELQEHTLDHLVGNHPDARLAHKITKDAQILRHKADKYSRSQPKPGEKKSIRQEARDMLKEANKLEEQTIKHVMQGVRIVCATTTGIDDRILSGKTFDWCIMDEASQCIEPSAWIPLQYADRLILAGDISQLPPTVLSVEAISEGFNVSFMERLLADLEPNPSKLLNIQYRMHKSIMEFSSQEFYSGLLQADPSVSNSLLSFIPGVAEIDLTKSPALFIDTAGASYDEELEVNGSSRYNKMEAEIVYKIILSLKDAGVTSQQIAVITPYSAQVHLLRERINDLEIEIDSVDGFQGREKEAVIVSLVRSNREGEVGFLKDTRRMNVALTRARRKIIVIGDSATISTHPFYQHMLAYFESIGAYQSIWEENIE